MKVKLNRSFAENLALYTIPVFVFLLIGLLSIPPMVPVSLIVLVLAILIAWLTAESGTGEVEIDLIHEFKAIKQAGAERQYRDKLHGLKQAARFGNNQQAREKLKQLGEDW